MSTCLWLGITTAVAEVDQFVPANVEVGDKFKLTITDDDGATANVEFTATAATVASVCTGLVALWNAETNPLFTPITAADATTALTLTADVAGVPFSVAPSTTNGGAATTQTLTQSITTANSGPNDYNVARNWSGFAVPVDGDDIVFPAGSPSCKYGLNQSSITAASVVQEEGHTGDVGRFDGAKLHYLRINTGTTKLHILGAGSLFAIDVGSAAVSPKVRSTGTASAAGRAAVYIKGSALVTINQESGDTDIAGQAGDTATVTGGFNVTGGDLEIRAGTTVAGTTARVKGSSSEVRAWVSVPTVVAEPEGTYVQEAGNWTTATAMPDATLNAKASGTYATTHLYGGDLVADDTLTAKTFTTINLNDATSAMEYVPALTTITTLNRNTYSAPVV